MGILAGIDLTDATGASATAGLFVLLGSLFALLVNALLKTGSRSDEVNKQITDSKDAEIARITQEKADAEARHTQEKADLEARHTREKAELETRHQRELGELRAETIALKGERDYWFKKYDDGRGGGK